MKRLLISVLVGLVAWFVVSAILVEFLVPPVPEGVDDLGTGVMVVMIYFGTFWATAVAVVGFNVVAWIWWAIRRWA